MGEVKLAECLGLQPVKNMSDELFHRISEMILNGTLEEGYIFPNETVLCEQLNVGRSTLREAYKALELTGYVTRSKRGGTVVNGKEKIMAMTPLKNSFENAEKTDFDEYRLAIEASSAAAAARNIDDAGIESLREIIHKMEEETERIIQFGDEKNYVLLKDMDRELHLRVAELSGNELFKITMMTCAQVWATGVEENFFNVYNKNLFKTVLEQHRDIVEAIASHDSLKARDKMVGHVAFVTDIK